MRDPIFKGATRPAMMAGVPLVPFILVAGLHIIGCVWSLILIGIMPAVAIAMFGILCILVMRAISKTDDQKLNQVILKFRSKGLKKNNQYWGAHSVSPIDYRGRNNK